MTSHLRHQVTIRVTVTDPAIRTLSLRSKNLNVRRPTAPVRARRGRPAIVEWKVRRTDPAATWFAVVVADGNISRRREVSESSAVR